MKTLTPFDFDKNIQAVRSPVMVPEMDLRGSTNASGRLVRAPAAPVSSPVWGNRYDALSVADLEFGRNGMFLKVVLVKFVPVGPAFGAMVAQVLCCTSLGDARAWSPLGALLGGVRHNTSYIEWRETTSLRKAKVTASDDGRPTGTAGSEKMIEA